MFSVDRSSPVPAYFQIAADLERRVEQSEWAAGERLPGESMLSAEYGVTRMTLRQALAQLAKAGMVELRRGRGAFVLDRRRPVVWELDLTSSAIDFLFRAQGHELGGELLSHAVVDNVPRLIRESLRTSGPIFTFDRRIFVNGRPVALHTSWFALDRLPGLDVAPGLDGPLARVLDRFGAVADRAEHEIEVLRATPVEASTLETRIDTPLVLIEGTSFTRSDDPLEHYQMRLVGDRVRFRTSAHS